MSAAIDAMSPLNIQKLAHARVLVIGDLILDHYIRGTTDRTSPEAPVPVVLFHDEESIPGGAANVARNIRAAGAQQVHSARRDLVDRAVLGGPRRPFPRECAHVSARHPFPP